MDCRPQGRKRDQDRRARVAELRARGLSLAEIGVELGVSPQAVSSMLQRIGAKGKQADA
jgi:lambda repressor-like predicted transcriptional regulator